MLKLEDFVDDKPTTKTIRPSQPADYVPIIEGVRLIALSHGEDKRGELNELLTLRGGDVEPIVHVYQVQCQPQSVRGWVYHKHQFDRLAYTSGHFRTVLYDLRPESPSYGKLEVFDLGAARRCMLFIPPFVVHGVKNCGAEVASFVNMPTRAYDPEYPDKSRLPINHPGVPYRFD